MKTRPIALKPWQIRAHRQGIDVMMRHSNADHERTEEKGRPDLWTWVADIKEVTT
ncbi:MAG: hypothetical protein ACPG6R_10900 [Aequoribacter sp.]|uniref:hypothetical protein n=1 Tax=Aequoribacter sp. TaxID=2847771 RepID=UPI003C37BDF1